jgi:hypothetical protein
LVNAPDPGQVVGQHGGLGLALELYRFHVFERALVGGQLGHHQLVFAALDLDAERTFSLSLAASTRAR